MSTFPSVVATLTNPNATDRLNAPSHSSIHTAVNGEVLQVQTFIGTLSSVQGTMLYDIRSPLSDGGGHVQAANRGGTGQTAYTKGDILIAQSNSVLTKLAVSSVAGDVLTADPNQQLGVKWGTAGAVNNIYSGSSVISISGGRGSVETILYAASIVGSTLGSNKAVHYTGYIDSFILPASKTFTLKVKYGNNLLHSSNLNTSGTGTPTLSGSFDGYLVGKAISSQMGNMKAMLAQNNINGTQTSILFGYAPLGTASVETSASQDLVITGQFSDGSQTNSILTGIFVVEKIG